MGEWFTPRESSAVYRLLAEITTDIVLKLDRGGMILHASRGIERLGLHPAGTSAGRHLRDLVDPAHAAAVLAEHAAAMAGRRDRPWLEFPARTSDDREAWFAIRIRGLEDDEARIYGAVAIMRSIEERRALEDRIFATSMTDPLTGLTNRAAFVRMLQHLAARQVGGCLAIFDLDHFKAINLAYGQAIGDEILVVFADLVRGAMRAQDIISRIGGESFAVLMPRATPEQAEAMARRIIATLAEANGAAGEEGLPITASAGVATIGRSLDDTLKRAELAVALAKAKGRNRLELDGGARFPWEGERRGA